MQTRVLLATFSVREAVLLRRLDLPATLYLGLHRLPSDRLRAIDTTFTPWEFSPQCNQEGSPFPERKTIYHVNEPVPETFHPALTLKPTLVLVGWSPSSLSVSNCPCLHRAAAHLAAVRRHLGLPFDWQTCNSGWPSVRADLLREVLRSHGLAAVSAGEGGSRLIPGMGPNLRSQSLTNFVSQTCPRDKVYVPRLTNFVSRLDVSPYNAMGSLTRFVSPTMSGGGHKVCKSGHKVCKSRHKVCKRPSRTARTAFTASAHAVF